MTAKKRRAKPESHVIRISPENYRHFNDCKRIYAARNKLEKVTYNRFITELLRVADMLQLGEEVYTVDGKVFDDIAEARGYAIYMAVKQPKLDGEIPRPEVLLRVGQDDAFTGWP
jgi:hypothetical protein